MIRLYVMHPCARISFIFLLALSGCSTKPPRSAKEICEKANSVKMVAPLVHEYGDPDRKEDGAPPVQWWFYDGKDGVCVVPVYGSIINRAEFQQGATPP
jgi:hypothetical protein